MISRLHGTVEWQSFRVDLKFIPFLSILPKSSPGGQLSSQYLIVPFPTLDFVLRLELERKVKEYCLYKGHKRCV